MLAVRARVRPGHPWVFANEILDPPVAALPPGAAVAVHDAEGRFVGVGLANPHALICVRLYARERVPLDAAFFRARLEAALRRRARALPGRRSMRVCAGEADGLGGLLIDRFEDVLSVQVTTLGVEQRLDLVREAVEAVLAPRGAVLRNDVPVRALEGLGGEATVWFGEVGTPVAFEEAGVRLLADLVSGQKTGFFFDQAENRLFWRARADGARALDVYAHSGAWALAALAGGARHAVAVDSSEPACALIRENARRNGWADRLEVIRGDAREVMASLGRGERFDLVSVDPPAFAKNRKSAGAALHAYKQVNTLGFGTVAPGGLYFASSCSHHVHPERFEAEVNAGARRAGRGVVLIRRGMQAPDHPVLPGVPETEYLKHLVYAVD